MSEVKDTVATYEADFYAWTREQAALLRARRFDELDLENIAEEMDCLGRVERRELESRLAVLLLHLLKWQFQPGLRGASWEVTIIQQRRQLHRHMRDNPSLRAHRDTALAEAYGDAVIRAEKETGFPRDYFPWSCPYAFDRALDDTFWPEAA